MPAGGAFVFERRGGGLMDLGLKKVAESSSSHKLILSCLSPLIKRVVLRS